jgi:hypothetical protein
MLKLPVEAHSIEDCIVELNGSGNHKSWVGSLRGSHLGWFVFLWQLFWFRLLRRWGFIALDAVALGVFKMSAAFGGERGVQLKEWLGVEVLGEKIKTGVRRRP